MILGSRSFRSSVKWILDVILPDRLYLKIARVLFLFGNEKRHGSRTNFSVWTPGIFLASDPGGKSVFFCERTRFRIYHYPDGVAGRLRRIAEKYQQDEVRVNDGDTVIDIGANIGEFALAVQEMAGRVIALEPDPIPFNCLSQNCSVFDNIAVYQIAVSNYDGDGDFFLSTKDADSSLVQPNNYTQCIKMKMRTLDALVEDLQLARIGFLKVEAEGWEPEILAGGKQALERTERVAVDAGPERRGQSTKVEVLQMLENAGFDLTTRDDMVFGIRRAGRL